MTNNTRIALVTGANKGMSSQGLRATFVALDTGDETSIAAAAAIIEAEHGHLDILVNNAGIVDQADGIPSRATLQAVRRVLENQ